MPHPLIAELDLSPHPEGGWYRETIRRPDPAGGRDRMTAILFLLEAGQPSHWHRVDADELWLWHAGAPLRLRIADDDGEARHALSARNPQALVPAGDWQSAAPEGEYSLVSCVVTPGFEFAGFELAPIGWEPNRSCALLPFVPSDVEAPARPVPMSSTSLGTNGMTGGDD